jgi:hypothetical protein
VVESGEGYRLTLSWLEWLQKTRLTQGVFNGSTIPSAGTATAAGASYVYRRIGGNWVQEAYIKSPVATNSDRFGWRQDIDGDTLIIGAETEDSGQATIINGFGGSADDSEASVGQSALDF